MSVNPIDAMKATVGLNPRATKLAAGGFVVLILGLAALQQLNDEVVTLWQMLGALVGLIVLMMVLSELPRFFAQLTGGVMCLGFLAWMTALLVQIITGNGVAGMATTHCLTFQEWGRYCSIAPANATTSGETTGVVRAPDPGDASAGLQPGALPTSPVLRDSILVQPPARLELPESVARQPTRGLRSAETGAAPFVPPATPVFLVFAGFERDEMVALAARLVQDGWRIEGADRGGNRQEAAAGINEVRYFHRDDLEAARALAGLVSAYVPGRPAISLTDLSATRWGRSYPGEQLEIWISR